MIVQSICQCQLLARHFQISQQQIMEQIALKWNDFEENVKSAFKVS
jgi:hypothetical protein